MNVLVRHVNKCLLNPLTEYTSNRIKTDVNT